MKWILTQGEEEEAADQFAPKMGTAFSREDRSRMLRSARHLLNYGFDKKIIQVHRHRALADEERFVDRGQDEEAGGGGRGQLHLDNTGVGMWDVFCEHFRHSSSTFWRKSALKKALVADS